MAASDSPTSSSMDIEKPLSTKGGHTHLAADTPHGTVSREDATLPSHEGDPVHDEELEISGNIPEPVEWDSDPENPLNWTFARKWKSLSVVSIYTLTGPLASSMMAPGLADLAEDYGITNHTVIALTLSIFLIGFGIGPMIFAPLSEMYGRRWVLHLSTLMFLVFNLASIWSPNTVAICIFRVLAGLGGSAAVGVGGGCVSDVFSIRERATAMGIYTLGPLLGPVVGPVAGGFLVGATSWRYIFVVTSALAGASLLFGLPLLEETYAPYILERRAARRIRDEEARGEVPEKPISKPKLSEVLWLNLSRPFILLTRSLVCFMLAAYMGVTYGIMYLMFATFPTVFNDVYQFDTSVSGLAYLGLGIGFFASNLIGSRIMNSIFLSMVKKNGGVPKPEFRLPLMIAASIVVPIGLFIFGWTARPDIHWIVCIIGTAIFGLAVMLSFLAITLYLVDSFTYAASALAAASFLRAMFGFAFPLFASQMYEKLEIGPGTSLLAGVAIVVGIPFPIWLYYYGEKARKRSTLMRR